MPTKELLGPPAALVSDSRLPCDRKKKEVFDVRSRARKAVRAQLLRDYKAQEARAKAHEYARLLAEHTKHTAENAAFLARLNALIRSRVALNAAAATAAAAAAAERRCREVAHEKAAQRLAEATRLEAKQAQRATRRAATDAAARATVAKEAAVRAAAAETAAARRRERDAAAAAAARATVAKAAAAAAARRGAAQRRGAARRGAERRAAAAARERECAAAKAARLLVAALRRPRPAAAAAARAAAHRHAEATVACAEAAALHQAVVGELDAALGSKAAKLTQAVVEELVQKLSGRGASSLLAVAAGGPEALRAILPSNMPFLIRRDVVNWARAERYAQQQFALGAGCCHTFVLPLRLALWPRTHAEAAGRMLAGVVAATPEMPALGTAAVAAWDRFQREVAPVDAPHARLLVDAHLWEIRSRFAAHPILGLLWQAAQTLDWAGGSDGWREVRFYGIAAGAQLRIAGPLPPLVQMGVSQHVSYAQHIHRWCDEGAVAVCYGCGDCTQYDSVKELKPRHLLLFGKSRAGARPCLPCPLSLTSLTSFARRSSPRDSLGRQQKSTPQHFGSPESG